MTVKIKLNPTKHQRQLLVSSSRLYIEEVNKLVHEMVEWRTNFKRSSKDILAPLNSAVKNQVIRDAKSIYKKVKKEKFEWIPYLKNPIIVWNNQNYSISEDRISMPFIVDGKSKKLSISAVIPPREGDLIKSATKLGTLRITKKNNKWMAQISLTINTSSSKATKVMGVDLGIKNPAVCVTDEGEVKFCGNGRRNKYFRRYHNYRRKKLGKAKKLKAIRKSQNKEQRYMKDQDHKMSRQVVNFAVSKKVGIIHLEELSGVRQRTRTSRKNNHSLSNWSFYRLAMYIEYKANLTGIQVDYVKPQYTSQICPNCAKKNHASDRLYQCSCGYRGHRDLVGAKNIRYAPVSDGKSLAA